MHEMLTIVIDVHSVSLSLSRNSSRLHCKKVAEQIKMLFGVNTPDGPWNIVLDMGPDPPLRAEGGSTFKFWDPLISGMAEAKGLNFGVCIEVGLSQELCKSRLYGVKGMVT